MPIAKSMGLLSFIIMLTGATSGWLNSGITSLFLTTWGPEKSKPYIASFHFTFSIGATLAPYLVGIYMDPNTEAQCGNNSTFSVRNSSQQECDPKYWPILCEDDYFDDLDLTIIMPYWIVAIAVCATGIIMIASALLKLVEAVTTNQEDIVDTRKEDTWKDKDMLLYFLVVMMIFFCAADMDTIFQSYLKIYGMCSPTFQLTPKDANDVVTIFWIAFAVGRLSGIFLTPFFPAWGYVAVDIAGSVVAVVILICMEYLLPNTADNYSDRQIALIIPTIVFAVFVSCIYGCATNFTNEYTNMSLSYIYLTQAGNSVGVMTLPAITGSLVKDEPVWMCWMVFIVSVGCAIFMFLTHLQGKRVLKKFEADHLEEKISGVENDGFESKFDSALEAGKDSE